MTLSRYTSKDLDKIFDAVSTYSVGYDDLFNRMLSYGQVAPQYPTIQRGKRIGYKVEGRDGTSRME